MNEAAAFPHRRFCCPLSSSSTTAASDSLPSSPPTSRSSTVIERDAPTATPQGRQAREGLPSSHRHHPNVPSPLRRRVLQGWAAIQALHPFHGLRPDTPGSALPLSRPKTGSITTRQASLDATDRWLASPKGLSTLGQTQPATGPPGSYPDGTHTRRRRQACAKDHELHLDLQLLGERYGQDKAEKSIRTAEGRYLSTGSRSRARVRSSALGRV